MTINVYDKGDLVRVSGPFLSAAGDPADPTALTFRYTTPAGATVVLTYGTDADLVKDSTGNYHVDLQASESGIWVYRWAGTGATAGVDEGEFVVQPSEF